MSDEQQARPAPKVADTPRARHYHRASAIYDCMGRLIEALERIPGDPFLVIIKAQMEVYYEHMPKEPQ